MLSDFTRNIVDHFVDFLLQVRHLVGLNLAYFMMKSPSMAIIRLETLQTMSPLHFHASETLLGDNFTWIFC